MFEILKILKKLKEALSLRMAAKPNEAHFLCCLYTDYFHYSTREAFEDFLYANYPKGEIADVNENSEKKLKGKIWGTSEEFREQGCAVFTCNEDRLKWLDKHIKINSK